MGSQKNSTRPLSKDYYVPIKVEPDDFHDSVLNVSEQIESTSNTSELSQTNDKYSLKKTGEFC